MVAMNGAVALVAGSTRGRGAHARALDTRGTWAGSRRLGGGSRARGAAAAARVPPAEHLTSTLYISRTTNSASEH